MAARREPRHMQRVSWDNGDRNLGGALKNTATAANKSWLQLLVAAVDCERTHLSIQKAVRDECPMERQAEGEALDVGFLVAIQRPGAVHPQGQQASAQKLRVSYDFVHGAAAVPAEVRAAFIERRQQIGQTGAAAAKSSAAAPHCQRH